MHIYFLCFSFISKLCIFIVMFMHSCCYVLFCIYSVFIVPAGTLHLPWLRFFCAFSSVVRQMTRYNPQSRSTARTLSKLILLFCVLFVCKCVLFYCDRVSTQLQLRNISISWQFLKRNTGQSKACLRAEEFATLHGSSHKLIGNIVKLSSFSLFHLAVIFVQIHFVTL